MPGGQTCGGNPCWKASGSKGYGLKDAANRFDGAKKIALKGNTKPGKTKLSIAGAGANLDIPALPLDDSNGVLVQLIRSDDPTCWEQVIGVGTASTNQGDRFKAK